MCGHNKTRHLRLSSKMAVSVSYQSITLTAKPPAKKQVFVQYPIGGDDENRTRVREPIRVTFFADSLSFKFPSAARRQTGSSLR